jgi:hypothetical protein
MSEGAGPIRQLDWRPGPTGAKRPRAAAQAPRGEADRARRPRLDAAVPPQTMVLRQSTPRFLRAAGAGRARPAHRLPAPPAPLTAAEREKAAAGSNPGLQRALYAIAIGLRPEGVREWNYTTNLHHKPGGMPDRELLAAADFACEREVWDRCINTSERTKQRDRREQRFPMPLPRHRAASERRRTSGLTRPMCTASSARKAASSWTRARACGRLGLDAGHAGHGAK